MTKLITAPESLEPDSPLWRFALWFWKQPEVESLCLTLQAEGWHVSKLLAACWMTACGQDCPAGIGRRADQWHTDVTGQLRRLRKQLDRQSRDLAPVRSAIARAELEAEQVELALMYHELTRHQPVADKATGPVQAQLASNLRAIAPDHITNTELTELASRFYGWLAARPTGERTE